MDRSLRVFDAHFHIIDPRFPLHPNQGFLPEPFTVEDYRARVAHFGVVGGAVVSASFQGSDQTYLVDAQSRLGEGFVGVTQLPPTVTDAKIAALASGGFGPSGSTCTGEDRRGSSSWMPSPAGSTRWPAGTWSSTWTARISAS
jgi:predicted TIM-barrel fold metal-dependent hydrolase